MNNTINIKRLVVPNMNTAPPKISLKNINSKRIDNNRNTDAIGRRVLLSIGLKAPQANNTLQLVINMAATYMANR